VKEHLVAFEYGTGTAWGYVVAQSAEAIEDAFPELDVVEQPPEWMTTEDLGAVRAHCTFTLTEGSLDTILEAKKTLNVSMVS